MKYLLLAFLAGLGFSVVNGDLNARPVNINRRATGVTQAARALDTGTTIQPLASISLGMPTKVPPTFTGSYAPGATPPISGAPRLPKALSRVGWPPSDKVPDTNSPHVQKWLKELDGVSIPNIAPTKDGTCSGDPTAAAEASKRGWWTCGSWTRSTDILACPNKLDWGLTFDDGPSPYTPNLLKKLKDTNTKASFYVIGSRVIDRPNLLIEEYMSGHEIGVHTWSHASLTSLTNEQIVAELGWTRKAIKAVLGVTPTTMRPPKGDIDDRVRAISLAMGLIPVLWTSTPDGGKFDSFDWRVASGEVTGQQSFEVFQNVMRNATTLNTGFITLQHDLFEITVDIAVGYTLDAALAHVPKFSLQPVGQCVQFNQSNLYRETNKNATFPRLRNDVVDISGDGSGATSIGVPKGAAFMALAAVVCSLLF